MLVWTAPVDMASRGVWKYGGKRNTLFLCLGTAYDISSMESVGNYSVVFVDGKSMPHKIFLPLNLSFELWHLYKSLLPSTKGLSIYFMQFFIWVSIFSYKAPTKGHYDRTWALDVANMRVCFMNGSMIEHDGLGITFFSVDILKDMVACWYAWVLMSSCQIIDYCFEWFKSKCLCYKIKEYMINMIGCIPHQKFCFQL